MAALRNLLVAAEVLAALSEVVERILPVTIPLAFEGEQVISAHEPVSSLLSERDAPFVEEASEVLRRNVEGGRRLLGCQLGAIRGWSVLAVDIWCVDGRTT